MENLNEQQLDAIINSPLPGVDTGVSVGNKLGWNQATLANVSQLEDGEDVLINKGGKVKQLKWNKLTGMFEAKGMVPTGEKTLVYSQTGQVIPKDVTKESVIESFTPDQVDAFAAGSSAFETARDSAIRATPGALSGIGGFMAGAAIGGGLETPLGWVTGIGGSMLASGATDAALKYGFKIEPSEQDAINAQLNPTAAVLGSFAPTMLAFRPSGSLLKAAAGFETAGITQANALRQVAKGGLMNMGIAQASSTAEALVHGAPGTDRLTAAARTLGFGDPTVENGGEIGDRLMSAGREFALGAGVLHKTWGAGALMHNAAAYATGGKPSTYVKMSGAPTWDAIRAQAMDRQSARLAAQAELMKEVTGNIARERGISEEQTQIAPGLTQEQKVGLTQIKSALADALKRNIINQETHDTANLVADTMGAELLKHIQLRQIGGRDGTALGSSNAVFTDGRGVFNAVKVFADAINRNKFQFTLSHEILHPLFQSLKPEIQAEIKAELIKQRAKARSSNKAMDYILSKLGIENDSTWDFDKFTLSEVQMTALADEMRKAGVPIPKGMFEARTADDGSTYFRLRPGYEESESGRRVYRLKDAHEFFSDEGARIIRNRGKYDSKWGSQKWYDVVAMIQSMYHGMRKALQSTGFGEALIGKRSQIDVIMDRIAEKNFGEVSMSGKGEIAADAQIKSDLATRLKDIDTSKVGDALEELTKARGSNEAAINDALRGILATEENGQQFRWNPTTKSFEEAPEQTQRIRDAIRSEGGEVTLSNRFLSEGDVDPANPPAAKGTDEILAKLGIKRTVAANVVQHRKIGYIEGFHVMDTPEKVTHAFRDISHMTQESIQMLVTDKNHKPLEIIRHTMSEPGASSLSSLAMAAQVVSIKGAAHVWVTHNHPSETPELSVPDTRVAHVLLNQVFKKMGVKPLGFFAQAGEHRSAFSDTGFGERVVDASKPVEGDKMRKIPIVERRFEFKRGTGHDVMSDTQILVYQDARDFASKTLGEKPGLIFLDKNNNPVGTHEIAFKENGSLGRKGAREMVSAFSRTSAHQVVLMTGGKDVPADVQENLAKNVNGAFDQITIGSSQKVIKSVVSMDRSGNVDHRQINEEISRGYKSNDWKSEGDVQGDENFVGRTEHESRVGATKIKPLHAAPNVKFPIPAEKLKKFGIDAGHMNQFSEHAVVGKVESPVAKIESAKDAAMFIDDYAGHLVQGQLMILITDKNGKPLQVGLHMIQALSGTKKSEMVYSPMVGVLAGQAVSTPGAKEAWYIRINNGEPSVLTDFHGDRGMEGVDALRNVLDGTGITFRGALAISDGRYSFNPLKDFQPGGGVGEYLKAPHLTVVDQQIPVSDGKETHSFKITERRYSSRNQIPYGQGSVRTDAVAPNPKNGRRISFSAYNDSIEAQMGKKSGIVFTANSGVITAVYPMTIEQMTNIRNSPAQKAILAIADRAGTNWATIHFGDVNGKDKAAMKAIGEATNNMGRFLKQANLKNDEILYRDSSRNGEVMQGWSTHDNSYIESSQMQWKSEGDQERAMPGDSFPDVPSSKANNIGFTEDGRRVFNTFPWPSSPHPLFDKNGSPTPGSQPTAGGERVKIPLEQFESDLESQGGMFTRQEVSAFNLKSGHLIIPDRALVGHILTARVARDSQGNIIPGRTTDHRADFERAGFELGSTIQEQRKNLTAILSDAFDNRIGIARIGQGFGNGIRSPYNPNDTRISVIGTTKAQVIQMVFDVTSNGNELVTAYPIDRKTFLDIQRHESYKTLDNVRYIESRGIARTQAKAGLQNPNELITGAQGVRQIEPPKANPERSSSGNHRWRGMLKDPNFSEGDAKEFGDRAKSALEQDAVVGPESIKGDFLGWIKSVKVLADQHLYQHPFPGNSGDYEGDIARDKERLGKHAVLDQVIAKMERQKGFNPMTLKPGMLKQVRKIHDEVVMTAFKEIGRNGLNMVDFVQDDMPMRHVRFYLNALLSDHAKFTDAMYKSMQAGMTSKKTGMELIDMANDMRSRFVHIYDSNYPDDYTRKSEGDAENMMIPGGAREAAMNARPKKQIKTYLNIGHGNIEGAYGNAEYVGGFKPEDTFLYMYDHNKGKFTVRNVADMANEENVKATRPDDFAHGMGGNGIETGIGLKSRKTGLNGRIEIDHENKTILVSAGQGRGKLDAFSARREEMMKRSDALKEIRSYVEFMQKKGELPAGYKIEGYGFPGPYERDFLGYEPGFQERFSEGDVDLKTPNHQDKDLESRGFITKYADENISPRFRNSLVATFVDDDGNAVNSESDFRAIPGSQYRNRYMVMTLKDSNHPNSKFGDVMFSVNLREKVAYFEATNVYGNAQGKGFNKLMYAEIGERLRRLGINKIEGYVVDDKMRPILARKAVFGEGSTTYRKDTYVDEDTGERKFSGAEVLTNVDPNRKLSEGDQIATPPSTNPKTKDGEVANHTDVQLAKRGFITQVAKDNAKSMAGMKMTIQQKGYTKMGAPTYLPKVEGSIEGGEIDGMGEFHGVIEYNGENGLQKVADFIYKVMPGSAVGDGTGDLDWIKVQPIWRNRNISTVITAEVVERIRRSYGGDMNAFVVDPNGRPIHAINRVLGRENVEISDNGFEETSPRDQFAQQTGDGEYVRRSWDVNGKIDPKKLYSEGDPSQNYEGLEFSENDVRKYLYGTPEERRAIWNSISADKKNRDEFRIMFEYIRNKDFEDRPRIREIRAKQEARRQEIVKKYKEQGHPAPEWAADRELNPPPTGPDPESELEGMRRSNRLDRGNFNSEGDDGENMRIPGGARDRFQRDTAGVKRQKPIRFWTDIGHADRTDAEGEENTYLWYATKKGDIQVISADELRNAHSPEGYQLIESDDIPTHADWETHLENGNIKGDFGKQPIMDLPHGRIDDRGDVTRISYMDHHRAGRTDYEHLRDEIKQKLADYMGKKADEMPGYDFTSTATKGTGPDRFSEGDAENGRFPNQVRARGKIPNARVNNGETDLGFTLGPGERLDSRGGIIRNRNTSNLGWGDIGHEPLQYKGDMFGEDIGKPPEKLIRDLEDAGQLQMNINFENGLFAYDASKGVFIHDTDMNRSSHAGWLGIPSGQRLIVSGKSGFNSDFGVIPSKYSYLGRIEPAIVTKDGTVERRGRISLGRNIEGKSWLEDSHEMRRGEFPPDFLTKLKQEAAKQGYDLVEYEGEGITEKQIHTPDMYDVYGFGMKKDKAEMGISRKDFGPVKMSEGDAETMRDVATRPIGEGKDGQARLKAIAAKLSEGDEVSEPPFRVPKVAPGRTNMELAKDIVTARFFTGISTKAHQIADDFPMSRAAKAVANMIHARAGAEAGVTGLDLPTAIMKERTALMNRFFDIMEPLRGEFAAMSRDARETSYREFADMVTGNMPIDMSTSAGRAANGLKSLLRDIHDYRVAAGEKLGDVADYFPAVYDSIRIADNAVAFKDDAKQAYLLELANEFQGQELDDAAEKAARELTMSHVRGESAGMFNSFFEEGGPSMGENSSKSRTFGPEAQQIMSKWQVKDPYRIISRYISGATKSAEIVRRLGDEGQKWRKMAGDMEKQGVSYEKIDEMRDLLKASVGIGRTPNSRGEQTFIDLMGLYTAGSVMGRSFLNNMFEPGSMGMRAGNLNLALQAYAETWGRTIRNGARIVSGERIDKTFWEKYAEHIGTMSADINDAWMNSHSIEVDGDRSDPRINWLTSKVYQSNLLQLTENAKLQASHAIGFKYLVNLAEMQQGRSFMNRLDVSESVKSNLRELGIDDADHSDFAKWMLRLEGMDDAARMRTMLNGGRMSKLFETAMTKFSMQSSVRANRAHKPVFQDGPIGKTLFQLMSYSYAYAAEINSRAYDYAKSSLKSAPAGKSYTVGDRIRFLAPLMMAPLGVIAFRAMFELKDKLYPTQYSKQHENDPEWTKWLNASSFAGIFGPKIEMATKYVMRDQPPGGPLGQAAIGYARAAKTAISNAMEGKPQDNAKRQAAKASVQPIKAAAVIGATAFHPVAGAIASQIANSTTWSNAMTEPDKNEAITKPKHKGK